MTDLNDLDANPLGTPEEERERARFWRAKAEQAQTEKFAPYTERTVCVSCRQTLGDDKPQQGHANGCQLIEAPAPERPKE